MKQKNSRWIENECWTTYPPFQDVNHVPGSWDVRGIRSLIEITFLTKHGIYIYSHIHSVKQI